MKTYVQLLLTVAVLGLGSALTVASWAESHRCPQLPSRGGLRVRLLRVGDNATSAQSMRLKQGIIWFPWRTALHDEPEFGFLLGSGVAAAAFNEEGRLLTCASSLVDNDFVYLAPAGVPWQWAAEVPGHRRQVRVQWSYGEDEELDEGGINYRFVVDSPPGTRESRWELAERGHRDSGTSSAPVTSERTLTVETLSAAPPIFRIRGLLPDGIADALVTHAMPDMEPSTVGDGSAGATIGNRVRDGRRTSDSAWLHGFNDPRKTLPAARAVQRAAASLLRLAPRHYSWQRRVEPLLCVRYGDGAFYEPHHDFFAGGPAAVVASDPVYAPPVGSNRFATLLFYMSEPLAGGHTVFPFATRHGRTASAAAAAAAATAEGGEGSVDGVAFAGDPSAPACEFPELKQERGMLITPRRGDAILFYNQRPDGSLDGRTRHGSCPVHGSRERPKWVANLWAWNREALYR